MSDREITDLLARAGDDQGRPLRTDPAELIARARRETVRRRRVRGAATLLVAAALVVGVVLVPRLVGDRAAEPVAPRPTTHPSPILSAETIVARCRPQLAKYAAYPQYGDDPSKAPWHLDHRGHLYRTGDVVELSTRHGDLVGRFPPPNHQSSDPVLCVVPAEGAEHDPVGFDQVTPRAGDPSLLRAVCAEQSWEVGDLHGATVLASSFSGEVGSALLRGHNNQLFGCATGSPTWRRAPFEVRPVYTGRIGARFPDDGAFITTGGAGTGRTATTFAVLAGKFDRAARTLEMTEPESPQPTRTFSIEDGYVAAAAQWTPVTVSRLMVRTWRVKAADGTVLASGTF